VNELEIERDRRTSVEQALGDAQTEIDSLAKQSEEAICQWQGKDNYRSQLHFTNY
jgi:hypothetical protein